MKPVVVNVSAGSWYPKGQERLEQSLRNQNYQGDRLYFGDTCKQKYPKGSPWHQAIPYAFKLYGLKEAQAKGYDTLLWADSSMYAVSQIGPILAHADQHGAACWLAGWSVGEWTSEKALPRLGLTRDEAMSVPLIVGGLICISTKHVVGRSLLDMWFDYATDRVSFPGPWDNKAGAASSDARVLGHRHDMPSLSVLVKRLGIAPLPPPKWFAYETGQARTPDDIFLARGM